MPKILTSALLVLSTILLISCEDQITTECNTKASDENPSAATLANVQAQVFSAYCTGCHGGAAPQGNLSLEPGKAYTELVNAASSSSTLKRVAPGNGSDSYLLNRIKGEGSEVVMPPSGKIPQELIDLVEQWIEDGAQNN